MSSVRYSACIFKIKSRWKRRCGGEPDEGDDLSSYKWCASLLGGFALRKAEAMARGTKFERADSVLVRVGGAARGAGGSGLVSVKGSPEGAAAACGKRPMYAKCRFRAAMVAAVIISRDWGVRGGWGLSSEVGSPWSVGASSISCLTGEWRCESNLRLPRGRAIRGGTGALYDRGGRGLDRRVGKLASGIGCRGRFPLESPARCRCPS